MNMLTRKQYKQRWLHLKYSLKKETEYGLKHQKVWNFQKSILSVEEQRKCAWYDLHLSETDPRCWVIFDSDKYLKKVIEKM